MSNLQSVVFGAASDGSQGDSTRIAFTKDNANIVILNSQATLTSFATTLTASAALTAAVHLGKRVNVNLSTAGTINLPTAASCGADGVILIRNLGTTLVTLAITAGSGDTISVSPLSSGETVLVDTDGVHAWNTGLRGRGSATNEVVQGNCAVNGNETVGGTLTVTGGSSFTVRPVFNGATPYDSNNLNPASYMPLGGGVFSGAPTYSSNAVARTAFQNAAAGKVVVVGATARIDFSTTTFPVTWTKVIDTAGAFSDSLHFTAPTTGIYRVAVTIGIGSAPTAGSYVDISVNDGVSGAIFKRNRNVSPTAGNVFTASLVHIAQFPAGQSLYVALQASIPMYTIADASFSGLYIDQIA